jgi:hypothetical protein
VTRPTYEGRARFRALQDATFTARYGNDRALREEGWRLVEAEASRTYGNRPGPFAPGDRVRTTRELYRGELPADSEGTFMEYRAVPDPFSRGGGPTHTTMAVVDFGPGRRDMLIGLRVLTGPFGNVIDRPAPMPGDVREAQKHADLAAAHERVARALDDLRKVEESYR